LQTGSSCFDSHDEVSCRTQVDACFDRNRLLEFRDAQPESYRDWVTSDHDLYDALARALPDYGLLPEPDLHSGRRLGGAAPFELSESC